MIVTLAQAYGSYSTTMQSGSAPAANFFFLMIIVVVVLIGLAVMVAVGVLLHVIQSRVPQEHQKMSPPAIWLMLIPIFGLVWMFFVFQRIPESYKSYFDSVGDTSVGDCGKSIGLWYAICAVCSIVPCLNYISGPAALVLLTIFMVRLFDLRGKLPEPAAGA